MSVHIEACERRCMMSHTLTATQRAAMNELGTLLVSYHNQRIIPQAVVRAVYNDLLQCVKNAHTAGSSAANKAIADARAAAKDGVYTSKERTLIASDVTLVLRSAGISKVLARQTGIDVNTLLHEPKVTSANVSAVFSTLVTIGASF